MTLTTQQLDKATDLGKDAGYASGSWVFDGNTSRETLEQAQRWNEDGDPEFYDHFGARSLFSGEYAGDYTEHDLAADCELEDADEDGSGYSAQYRADLDDLMDRYEEAFLDAHMDEVERVISEHLS